MRAVYLTGEQIYLRAMLLSDKEHAAAWYAGPYAISAARAEELLREASKDLSGRTLQLAIARREGDEVVGGVKVHTNWRHADLAYYLAPWLEDADELRAEALALMVPWLKDEGQHLTVTVEIPTDQPATIAAAEALGMQQTARFRERVARPGGRVDVLVFQALNPHWERVTGDD